jgi:lipopolysaccharide biosynthesis protein
LPSKEVVNELITKFKNNDLNMVGPKDHLVSLHRHMGSNKKYLKTLLEDIYNSEQATKIIKNDNKYNYFGGTMFWVSVSCIKPILDLHLLPEDFDSEKNQIDGTKAHAIERLFGVVTLHNGYKLNIISSLGVQEAKLVEADQKYKFAP